MVDGVLKFSWKRVALGLISLDEERKLREELGKRSIWIHAGKDRLVWVGSMLGLYVAKYGYKVQVMDLKNLRCCHCIFVGIVLAC